MFHKKSPSKKANVARKAKLAKVRGASMMRARGLVYRGSWFSKLEWAEIMGSATGEGRSANEYIRRQVLGASHGVISDDDSPLPDRLLPLFETATAGAKPSRTSTAGNKPSRTSTAGAKPSRTSTAGNKPSRTSTAGGKPSRTSTAGNKPSRTSTAGDKPSRTSTAGGNGPWDEKGRLLPTISDGPPSQ